jgi:mediator of RNA polymerase II transcription subunit 6
MAKTSCFIDVHWLQCYGLSRESVLPYFYTSPFYDPASNNAILQTQGIQLEHLTSMRGLEYMLDDEIREEPVLFVIRKQRRLSPTTADLLQVYYVLDGTIYQCPEYLELVNSRFLKASSSMSRAYREILDRIDFTPQRGHHLSLAQKDLATETVQLDKVELQDVAPLCKDIDEYVSGLISHS